MFHLGYKIIEDKNLVLEDGTTLIYVNRPISERLFTKLYHKKWKPFKRQKLILVVLWKPNPDVFHLKGQNIIIGHPETISLIREKRNNVARS